MTEPATRTDRDSRDDGAEEIWFPASFSQERLWYLEQLAHGEPAYHLPSACRLRAPLDPSMLETGLAAVAARHEILRTSFRMDGGKLYQVVAPDGTVPLRIVDLGNLPSEEREDAARQAIREEARRPFDLSEGPAVRCCIFQIARDDVIVLTTAHHIAIDMWSIRIFFREVFAVCEGEASGATPCLPELPIQFGDYSVWEKDWLAQGQEEQLTYWREALEGAETRPLPQDAVRPQLPTYRGAVYRFRIPLELADAVAALSRTHRTTPFVTWLASLACVLHRYSGSPDVILGTPVSNRPRRELENLIGRFINTVPLRVRCDGLPTAGQLIDRTRESCGGALANATLPLERIAEQYGRTENDVFRMSGLFSIIDMPEPQADAPIRWIEDADDLGTATLDINVQLFPAPNGYIGRVEYSTDIFDNTRISRLVDHWQEVAREFTRNPDASIQTLDMARADVEKMRSWGTPTGRNFSDELALATLVSLAPPKSPADLCARNWESTSGIRLVRLDANAAPADIDRTVAENGRCVVWAPASVLGRLHRLGWSAASLDSVLCSGSLSDDAVEPWRSRWPHLRIARIADDGTALAIEKGAGEPLLCCALRVVDPDRRESPIGVTGSIEYETVEGWLDTPFRARWDSNGTLRWLGRSDGKIEAGGSPRSAGSLEEELRRTAGLADAAIRSDETPLHTEIQLFAVAEASGNPDSIREQVEAAWGIAPGKWTWVESIPRDEAGTVDSTQLNRLARKRAYVAPMTPLEEELASIWSSILGVPRVGTEDNFFELGGESIRAVALLHQVRERFGVEMPLKTLFAKPTVGLLAIAIVQTQANAIEPDDLLRILEDLEGGVDDN